MKKIFFLLVVVFFQLPLLARTQQIYCVNITPMGGDRTEIGVPKVSYDPDMQVLSVAFQASGDYMLYIINGSGLAECGFRITTNGCVQTFQLPPLPESVYFVVITNGDSAYKGILDTSGYYY